jgi:hypothetical protein
MNNLHGIVAFALMIIPMTIFLGCTYKDKQKGDSLTDLSKQVIKSHEDIEIDIKATPSKK